jgi:hypothetical protein
VVEAEAEEANLVLVVEEAQEECAQLHVFQLEVEVYLSLSEAVETVDQKLTKTLLVLDLMAIPLLYLDQTYHKLILQPAAVEELLILDQPLELDDREALEEVVLKLLVPVVLETLEVIHLLKVIREELHLIMYPHLMVVVAEVEPVEVVQFQLVQRGVQEEQELFHL